MIKTYYLLLTSVLFDYICKSLIKGYLEYVASLPCMLSRSLFYIGFMVLHSNLTFT